LILGFTFTVDDLFKYCLKHSLSVKMATYTDIALREDGKWERITTVEPRADSILKVAFQHILKAADAKTIKYVVWRLVHGENQKLSCALVCTTNLTPVNKRPMPQEVQRVIDQLYPGRKPLWYLDHDDSCWVPFNRSGEFHCSGVHKSVA
jgi:hypothetical protein